MTSLSLSTTVSKLSPSSTSVFIVIKRRQPESETSSSMGTVIQSNLSVLSEWAGQCKVNFHHLNFFGGAGFNHMYHE